MSTLIRNIPADSNDVTVTSLTVNFGIVPRGTVLVTAIAIDKDSSTITTPSGWTLIHNYTSTNVSGAWAYKYSDGTETSVQWQWTTTQKASAWVGAIQEGRVFDVAQEADSGVSAVTSLSTGTTASTTYPQTVALAICASDSADAANDGRSWSKGFNEVAFVVSATDPGLSNPGLSVAMRDIDAIQTIETTFSVIDTGDQLWASVAAFYRIPLNHPERVPPIVTHEDDEGQWPDLTSAAWMREAFA
jgi:hypothetical protein